MVQLLTCSSNARAVENRGLGNLWGGRDLLSNSYHHRYTIHDYGGGSKGYRTRGKTRITSKDYFQWFDCKPGAILHDTVNAYETSDDKVVLHALRSEPTGEGLYYYMHNFVSIRLGIGYKDREGDIGGILKN